MTSPKHMAALLAGALLWVTVALPAVAGDRVNIRLVEATRGDSAAAAGLEDVQELLQNNLNYQAFALLASGSAPLPSKGNKLALGALNIELQGYQTDLYIKIRQGDRKLMQTSVSLEDGVPLILGGFPSDGGKYVLIFVAE